MIDLTDTLEGKAISSFTFSRRGLSGNEFVFFADFLDGSEGVFLTTVPEPALAPLFAILLMLRRRRIR